MMPKYKPRKKPKPPVTATWEDFGGIVRVEDSDGQVIFMARSTFDSMRELGDEAAE